MPITATPVTRTFEHAALSFPDPDPSMTNEAVRDLLATQYPELANAKITETMRDGHTVVRFERSIGKKG